MFVNVKVTGGLNRYPLVLPDYSQTNTFSSNNKIYCHF